MHFETKHLVLEKEVFSDYMTDKTTDKNVRPD